MAFVTSIESLPKEFMVKTKVEQYLDAVEQAAIKLSETPKFKSLAVYLERDTRSGDFSAFKIRAKDIHVRVVRYENTEGEIRYEETRIKGVKSLRYSR